MKKIPSKFSQPSRSPGYQLWRVSNIWQRTMRRALKDLDITHVQFVALTVTAKLCESQEGVNQVQIALAAGMDKMMTSQVLRTLEEKALIARHPDPADGRAMLLTLTDAGFELMTQALRRVEDADARFFGVLGDDSGAVADLLYRLADGNDDHNS